MAKHTPGPWHIEEHGIYVKNRVWVSADRVRVAVVDQEYIGGEPATLSIANARLIAAAPDLLAACKSVLVWFERWAWDEDEPPASWGWELKDELAAAIAKAEGADGT